MSKRHQPVLLLLSALALTPAFGLASVGCSSSWSTIAAYVPRVLLWDPSAGWVDTDLTTAGVELEFGTERTSYISSDGRNWSPLQGGGDDPDFLGAATAGPEGAIALTDMNGSSAVAVSSDGLSWTVGLFLPRQDDRRHGWLREVASGGLGRAVTGTLDPDPAAEVITVTVGSRTAR